MPSNREPQVVTSEGPVLGFMDEDIFVFKGIPYAAPPTKNLRWRPPEPVKHWTDPLKAQEYGAASFQNWQLCAEIGGGDPRPLSEDCLYLNVWTPQLQKAAPLPVMVWIHGGGYVIGAGGLPPYVGTPLAKRRAVVVSINYRLGHLGFFAHPALDKEYEDGEVVNNFALLDQIAALEWVQRNIAHFGGDPGNVTIFGQSAGARSVISLFASPRATGLFHKGVAQSVYGLPDVPREKALRRGEHFAHYFKVHESKDIPTELRKLDAELFWAIRPNPKFELEAEAGFGWPTPISGDAVLPKPILEVFEKGEQAQLPLIVGNNSDDSNVLAGFGVPPAYILDLLRQVPVPPATEPPPSMYDVVKNLYPGVDDDDELGRQVGRDLLFTTMSYLIVDTHAAAGAPSWRYYFDYVAEKAIHAGFPKGARHADEVSYVLDTGDIAPPTDEYFSERDKAFAKKVSHYWLEFARSASNASESIAGDVAWPKHQPFDNDNPNKTMGFGKTPGSTDQPSNTIQLESNFMAPRMSVFVPLLKSLAELLGKQPELIHSYQGDFEE